MAAQTTDPEPVEGTGPVIGWIPFDDKIECHLKPFETVDDLRAIAKGLNPEDFEPRGSTALYGAVLKAFEVLGEFNKNPDLPPRKIRLFVVDRSGSTHSFGEGAVYSAIHASILEALPKQDGPVSRVTVITDGLDTDGSHKQFKKLQKVIAREKEKGTDISWVAAGAANINLAERLGLDYKDVLNAGYTGEEFAAAARSASGKALSGFSQMQRAQSYRSPIKRSHGISLTQGSTPSPKRSVTAPPAPRKRPRPDIGIYRG